MRSDRFFNAPVVRSVPGRVRSSAKPKSPVPLKRSPTKPRLLIVHRSPVTRVGLAALLRASRRYQICGEAEDAAVARELFRRLQPDLVILGLSLAHSDGIELIKDFRREDTAARILVMTSREDILSLKRAFRAGARGYVLACDDTAEILQALNRLAAGEFYASPSASQHLLGSLADGPPGGLSGRVNDLSDRELQVFRLIGGGLGATRLAAELRVSVKTIESHRTRIKQKLHLASASELNARAASWLLQNMRGKGRRLAIVENRRCR